jgi:hypothetical protein
MQHENPQAVIEAYLQAFESRDIPACLSFYGDDAVVEFMSGTYRGKQAIEDWHKERFEAGLQILELDGINVDGDEVVVELVATSKRLKTFRINSLKGTGTFQVDDGQIKQAQFAARKGFAGNMSWLFRS